VNCLVALKTYSWHVKKHQNQLHAFRALCKKKYVIWNYDRLFYKTVRNQMIFKGDIQTTVDCTAIKTAEYCKWDTSPGFINVFIVQL
jgi:hypothetical protein